MSWAKREAVTNLVILGDGPDMKKSVGGLLIGTPFDRMYPDKMNYVIVHKDGEEIVLSGSASLGRQLSKDDIGKFVKCAFSGWGRSANGKFKIIDVNVWEGEANDEMKKWPRYAEFANGGPKVALKEERVATAAEKRNDKVADDGFEDYPGAQADDNDDDLPF